MSEFDREVMVGLWPGATRRGDKATRLTWDRKALDMAADRLSGIDVDGAAVVPPVEWRRRRGT